MSAHTPGPWAVVDRKLWGASMAVMAAKKVATPVAWASRLCVGGDDEAHANAALIAAAPEMLKALKRFDCQDKGSCGEDEPDGLCFRCAAIAKAEGKS